VNVCCQPKPTKELIKGGAQHPCSVKPFMHTKRIPSIVEQCLLNYDWMCFSDGFRCRGWRPWRDNTNSGTRSIVTLRFGSGFAVWQWTLLWLPGQNIKCRHATVSLEKTVIFSTFFIVTSYSRKVQHFHNVGDRAVGSVLSYGAADLVFHHQVNFFFSIAIYVMAVEAVKFHFRHTGLSTSYVVTSGYYFSYVYKFKTSNMIRPFCTEIFDC
jgi:hypothetical protein